MSSRVIVGTGVILLVAYLAAMEIFRKPDGRVVVGDATHQFVQLRSMVFDRDLHFQNEYTRIYNLKGGELGTEWITDNHTVTGYVRNYMPVGPALLWMPAYLLVAAVQLALSWVGLAAAPDGYDRALQLVPGVSGVLATVGAALLSLRTARRYVEEWPALVATMGVWIGSHALYYSLVSPSYSHSASMFASALFFWRWLDGRDAPSLSRMASWGALVGVAALMRWQDAIFLSIPIYEAIRWREPWTRRASAAALAVLCFVAVFSPQMAIWTVLYGQPLALPQGPAFMQWTSPHLADVLFSDNHGLLTWAPLLAVALAGLVAWLVRQPSLRVPIVAVMVISWYINAAVADWWGGEAFGARRFLSLFPLFTIGLAWWVAGARQNVRGVTWRVALVAVLTAANGLLLLQYQLFLKGQTTLAPYPGEWFNMFVVRFVVPFRLLQAWLN